MAFPVHLDSKINRGSGRVFADHPNITLVQPQDYVQFLDDPSIVPTPTIATLMEMGMPAHVSWRCCCDKPASSNTGAQGIMRAFQM